MSESSQRPAGDPEIDYRGIAAFGIGLVVAIAISCGILALLFEHFHRTSLAADPRPTPIVAETPALPPPGPRLQASPGRDLQEMLGRETAQLKSYGWVDRERGIVHIPIERAMDLLATGAARAPGSGAK